MAKTPISIRIESDLLEWFKQAAPDGYQVLMQDVLRSYQKKRERKTQYILGRAQQVFVQYHAKCFWHLRKDLQITENNLSLVLAGLRKYGGLEGLRLADELSLDEE